MKIQSVIKTFEMLEMKKRKMIAQEVEGVRDYLGFVLLFILKRVISWEYGKIQGGGSVVGTTNGKCT